MISHLYCHSFIRCSSVVSQSVSRLFILFFFLLLLFCSYTLFRGPNLIYKIFVHLPEFCLSHFYLIFTLVNHRGFIHYIFVTFYYTFFPFLLSRPFIILFIFLSSVYSQIFISCHTVHLFLRFFINHSISPIYQIFGSQSFTHIHQSF